MQAPAVVKAAGVGTALAVMLGVPALALNDQRPAFLGWQMYAGNHSAVSVEVTLESGSVEEMPLNDIAAKVRPEIDYIDAATDFLCRTRPEVESVRLTREYPAMDEERQCSSS